MRVWSGALVATIALAAAVTLPACCTRTLSQAEGARAAQASVQALATGNNAAVNEFMQATLVPQDIAGMRRDAFGDGSTASVRAITTTRITPLNGPEAKQMQGWVFDMTVTVTRGGTDTTRTLEVLVTQRSGKPRVLAINAGQTNGEEGESP